MTGEQFESNLIAHLIRWIYKHWDEINEDEWLLHSHILELIRLNVFSIKKSIFKHKIEYRDNCKVICIRLNYLYKDDMWYKCPIDIPYQLDNNAYKYNPREGF